MSNWSCCDFSSIGFVRDSDGAAFWIHFPQLSAHCSRPVRTKSWKPYSWYGNNEIWASWYALDKVGCQIETAENPKKDLLGHGSNEPLNEWNEERIDSDLGTWRFCTINPPCTNVTTTALESCTIQQIV